MNTKTNKSIRAEPKKIDSNNQKQKINITENILCESWIKFSIPKK